MTYSVNSSLILLGGLGLLRLRLNGDGLPLGKHLVKALLDLGIVLDGLGHGGVAAAGLLVGDDVILALLRQAGARGD